MTSQPTISTRHSRAFAHQAIELLDTLPANTNVCSAATVRGTMCGEVPSIWVFRHLGHTYCSLAGRADTAHAPVDSEEEFLMLERAHRTALVSGLLGG